jgi:hypothetical protein
MDDFHLISPPAPLLVEGAAESGVGDFRGQVLAIALQGTDPLAASSEAAPLEQEGLVGWGTTCFLVADERKRAPVWVRKEDVLRHSIDHGGILGATGNGRVAQGRTAEHGDFAEAPQ